MGKVNDFLKRAWTAIWKFVIRWWKPILIILAGGAGALAVMNLIRAREGKVDHPDTFARIPGDEDKLAVLVGKEWRVVDLPETVKAKQVTAIEVTPEHEMIVEVLHKPKNRRGR